MTLLCPRCRVALQERSAHELVIHGCTRCGGVWLDLVAVARLNVALSAQTLGAIDALASEASKSSNEARSIDCPCCAEILIRTPITKAGVVVDRCPDHGAWYDRNELQQVARALGTAPPPGPAPKPPKERNKKSATPPKTPTPPKSAPQPTAPATPKAAAPKAPPQAPTPQPPAASRNTSHPGTLIGAAEVILDIALSFFF